jgi:Protein of unknown function (DUF1552)
MNVRPFRLSRRAVLRSAVGAGAAGLALPRLDAMLNHHGEAYADGSALPKCFAIWYWGLGNDPKRWVPKTTGPGFELSEQLAPLAPVKDYVSLVTNMRPRPPRNDWPHLTGQVGLLTGDDYQGTSFKDGTVKRPSLDQVIANAVGTTTRFKSLEIRIGAVDPGQGTAQDHISHNGPNNPNRGETDVKAVFERLFGSGFQAPGGASNAPSPRDQVRKSILDLVQADAERLKPRLGTNDRARLDQHLEGVRSLEQRLVNVAPAAPTCKKPPEPTAPADMTARHKMMSELVAMALACDMTRVVTYEYTSPATHLQFPEIGVHEDVHEWGHTHGVDDLVEKSIIYWMNAFSTFLTGLKNTPDASGNLLDRACVFGTSCTGFAPTHDFADFPLVIVGKGAGSLVYPGIHFRPAADDTASRVPLTLIKAMGLPATEWGVGSLHTDKPITELLT